MCVVNVGTVDVRRVRTLRLWLSCAVCRSGSAGGPEIDRGFGGSAPSPSLTRD